ncbi:RNA-binding domain-containing protein [Piedraia hortae CBS 480.64]|uniref:RNA-binding domain-containing protein n=1 Tax=Piedraia hortae CBS 480.64 TaxID=1314780 RepID=A0A6A7C8X7_9PEZI|nr:RNA-binding domain-containing protein [Piedraia hortae CBS 480.64]
MLSAKKRKNLADVTAERKKIKVTKTATPAPVPLKSALKKTALETPGVRKSALKKTEVAPKKSTKASKSQETESAALVPVADDIVPVDDGSDDGGELTADQTAALLAGFSDSEDDENDGGLALEDLPQPPRIKGARKADANDDGKTPGVIYIGRIPHGFYEHQMRSYFSQFGDILHLRLARNRKTGRSQHYGFIEFASKAVAEIVAKTMDKYLLFGHILQVRTVPREQVRATMWNRAGRRMKPIPRNKMEGRRLKHGLLREGWDKRNAKEEKRRLGKAEKLKELGYEFDMPQLKKTSAIPVAVPAVKESAVPAAKESAVSVAAK